MFLTRLLPTLSLLLFFYVPVQAANFTGNGDGTVTDSDTNLVWQQTDDDTGHTWEESLDYCNDLSLAGNSDWRLPNIKELESIVDATSYDPAIDTRYFPGAHASLYWSSTSYASNPGFAWFVNFRYGYVDSYVNGGGRTDYNYVRCVR